MQRRLFNKNFGCNTRVYSILILDFVDLIVYSFVTIERKREQLKSRSNDAPSTDVTRDRIAPILSALFVMSEATSRWKGPRYLAYDTYDARLRSSFTWPYHLHPSPHSLKHSRFLIFAGKVIIIFYNTSVR